MPDKVDRIIDYVSSIIKRLELDLSGLSVVTECASGNYAFTPLMAAMAGARQVYALGSDSKYGSFEENKLHLDRLSSQCDFENIEAGLRSDFNHWKEADIVTNLGQIRPIDGRVIKQLKETCVISLMWETWEFREADLDISACQEAGIAVVGTDEGFQKADMYKYNGLMALKILFELQAEVANAKLAVLGGGMTGELVIDSFQKLGLDFIWFTESGEELSERCHPYSSMKELLPSQDALEAIVVAEHTDSRLLLGDDGLVSFSDLKDNFPHLVIGHICGNIDERALLKSGINFYPNQIAPFGYMSFLPDILSPYPVLLLNAAGLKVGEISARARLAGHSVEEAIQKAVSHGIGQDFEGGFMNFRV